jgi:hypothetical protein
MSGFEEKADRIIGTALRHDRKVTRHEFDRI